MGTRATYTSRKGGSIGGFNLRSEFDIGLLIIEEIREYLESVFNTKRDKKTVINAAVDSKNISKEDIISLAESSVRTLLKENYPF